MSNTIRRARRRPRVDSINFRSLWWVLERTAYATALLFPGELVAVDEQLRRWLCTARTSYLRPRLERILERYPNRRIIP